MKKRIIGIDVARAIAVIGMIVVNFKIVLGNNGSNWVKSFASIFDGKAAATFVVLAGVGLALMTKTAIRNRDQDKIRIARIRILKRAFFLFIVGLSYIAIWPADILHFYGVYMAITVLFLKSKEWVLIVATAIIIIAFPLLMTIWYYPSGWDFNTLEYHGFWTIQGFIRNLFFNGFHPVVPWTSFMLIGYWFGQQDLHNDKFIKKTLWISLLIFASIQVISSLSIAYLSGGNQAVEEVLQQTLGTSPMPPLPIYMINGIAIALVIISACILFAKRIENNKIIDALKKTGQLALTFYVAHVIIGMGLIEAINPSKMGEYSVVFSITYALLFSLLCILFAIVWRKYYPSGPLEWVMRKITD